MELSRPAHGIVSCNPYEAEGVCRPKPQSGTEEVEGQVDGVW